MRYRPWQFDRGADLFFELRIARGLVNATEPTKLALDFLIPTHCHLPLRHRSIPPKLFGRNKVSYAAHGKAVVSRSTRRKRPVQ